MVFGDNPLYSSVYFFSSLLNPTYSRYVLFFPSFLYFSFPSFSFLFSHVFLLISMYSLPLSFLIESMILLLHFIHLFLHLHLPPSSSSFLTSFLVRRCKSCTMPVTATLSLPSSTPLQPPMTIFLKGSLYGIQ